MSKKPKKVKPETEQIDRRKRQAATKVLATAGIAATMSGNWKKPVLDSVVLPSHANLTPCDGTFDCSNDGDDG